MKNEKLGALWENNGPKGKYYTGEVEVDGVKVKVVCFPNGYKETDRHPDLIIYKSRPKNETPEEHTEIEPF